jgi:predicted ester cyclase
MQGELTAHSADLAKTKRHVHDALRALASAPLGRIEAEAAELYTPGFTGHVVHPINDMADARALCSAFWAPLKKAFPDLQRETALIACGVYNGSVRVACFGHYYGTFTADWLGFPAHHKAIALRFTEAHRMDGDRIAESWIHIDLVDLIHQLGLALLPESLGAEMTWPSPGGSAGLSLDAHDAAGGEASLKLVLRMHDALGTFDGRTLESMNVAPYWTEHFSWYGPGGIGTTRGLSGFRAHHQIPFLKAFPDRKGGQHYIRIADGPFVVTGGWPSVTATHTGDGFIGMPATGKRVGMRVMDFYRCEDGLIAENWVPIDILHLLLQMGYDVLARLAHLRGFPQRTL